MTSTSELYDSVSVSVQEHRPLDFANIKSQIEEKLKVSYHGREKIILSRRG